MLPDTELAPEVLLGVPPPSLPHGNSRKSADCGSQSHCDSIGGAS